MQCRDFVVFLFPFVVACPCLMQCRDLANCCSCLWLLAHVWCSAGTWRIFVPVCGCLPMFDAVQGLGKFLFLFVGACPCLMQCRDLMIFFMTNCDYCLVRLDAVNGLSDFCVHAWDCWWPVVYGTYGWLWATLKQSVTGDTTCGHLFRFCAW